MIQADRYKCLDYAYPTVYSWAPSFVWDRKSRKGCRESVMVFKATSDLSQDLAALVRVYSPELWAISAAIVLAFIAMLTLNYRLFAFETLEKGKIVSTHIVASLAST